GAIAVDFSPSAIERNIVGQQTARAEYPWILRPRCAVCLTAGALKRVVHTVRSEGDGQEIVAAIDDGRPTPAEHVGADGGNGRDRGRGPAVRLARESGSPCRKVCRPYVGGTFPANARRRQFQHMRSRDLISSNRHISPSTRASARQ